MELGSNAFMMRSVELSLMLSTRVIRLGPGLCCLSARAMATVTPDVLQSRECYPSLHVLCLAQMSTLRHNRFPLQGGCRDKSTEINIKRFSFFVLLTMMIFMDTALPYSSRIWIFCMELFRRSRTQIFGRGAGRFLCHEQAVSALPLEVQR